MPRTRPVLLLAPLLLAACASGAPAVSTLVAPESGEARVTRVTPRSLTVASAGTHVYLLAVAPERAEVLRPVEGWTRVEGTARLSLDASPMMITSRWNRNPCNRPGESRVWNLEHVETLATEIRPIFHRGRTLYCVRTATSRDGADVQRELRRFLLVSALEPLSPEEMEGRIRALNERYAEGTVDLDAFAEDVASVFPRSRGMGVQFLEVREARPRG